MFRKTYFCSNLYNPPTKILSYDHLTIYIYFFFNLFLLIELSMKKMITFFFIEIFFTEIIFIFDEC